MSNPVTDSLPWAETCDYCGATLGEVHYLRAVGMDADGRLPIVKAWCGICTPTDRMDAGAAAVLMRAFRSAPL